MKRNIQAFTREPHVARKLIRFNGFTPANIIDENKKLVAAIKIPQASEHELLKAGAEKEAVEIELGGKQYHTRVAKVFRDVADNSVNEVELALVG